MNELDIIKLNIYEAYDNGEISYAEKCLLLEKVYDKAAWHIDNGLDKNEVVRKFKKVFKFLKKHKLLNDNGLELFNIGIDSSISLNDTLLTKEGSNFLAVNYDKIINENSKTINDKLEKLYKIYMLNNRKKEVNIYDNSIKKRTNGKINL